ncbi:hypothetical protein AgCh_003630 [Apium graveolens]
MGASFGRAAVVLGRVSSVVLTALSIDLGLVSDLLKSLRGHLLGVLDVDLPISPKEAANLVKAVKNDVVPSMIMLSEVPNVVVVQFDPAMFFRSFLDWV